ncbi:MAG: F0F1 ATP synthase subunit B [Acidobacteriota bacterium]
MTATTLVLAAAPVLAAGGEGDGKGNIFAGDIGNVIWTLLTFGLALFVLGKFAWGPLVQMLEQREQTIHDALASAKEDREASKAKLEELEQRLADARGEASAIVEEGRRDAEATAARILEEARAEATKERDRALRDISIAKETAVQELYQLSGKAATEIAGRIVGRELSADDHQQLITAAIEDLSAKSAN